MTRAPLAKGDDGSSNRYPVRSPLGQQHEAHVRSGVPNACCHDCVPAALQVPTPERFDPPCLVDGLYPSDFDGPELDRSNDEAYWLEVESFEDHYGDEIEGGSTVEDYDVERDDRLTDDAQRTLF